MAKALTVKAIENLKPDTARREVPDGEVRGLYLTVFPGGKRSWVLRYRFEGRPRKLTIGPSPEIGLKDARDLARKAHVQIAGGIDPASEKSTAKLAKRVPAADRDLVEKVVAQFLSRHVKALAPATAKEVGRIFRKDILPAWQGRRLSQITKSDIHELLDGIVDRGAPCVANRTANWLGVMCNFAVERGLVETSPMAGIKPPGGQETPRDRGLLADGELLALWGAADALEQPYRGSPLLEAGAEDDFDISEPYIERATAHYQTVAKPALPPAEIIGVLAGIHKDALRIIQRLNSLPPEVRDCLDSCRATSLDLYGIQTASTGAVKVDMMWLCDAVAIYVKSPPDSATATYALDIAKLAARDFFRLTGQKPTAMAIPEITRYRPDAVANHQRFAWFLVDVFRIFGITKNVEVASLEVATAWVEP